jgi:hypothetical protein
MVQEFGMVHYFKKLIKNDMIQLKWREFNDMIFFKTITQEHIMEKLLWKYAMLFHSHVDMFMYWHKLNNNEILGKYKYTWLLWNATLCIYSCSYIDVFCCVGKCSWKYVKCLSLHNNLLLPKWWKKWKLLFNFWTIHVL